MAVDSIIAKPTNSVRVMVADASGCCASALSAVETERPSANAGIIQPMLVARPAVTIETTATSVMLSIYLSFGFARARGGRDVNRGQYAEDVGLHHAGEQSERNHDDRKDEGRDRQQNADNHRSAHHV